MKFGDVKGFLSGQRLARDIEEIRDLALEYVREETIEPVKKLGTFALYGCLGSFFVGLGGLFVFIGTLRLLGHLWHGTLSWLPYLVTSLLGCGVLLITSLKVSSGPARRRLAAKGSK